MAKKRARKKAGASTHTASAATSGTASSAKSSGAAARHVATAAPAPAFFFGYEVAWAKLLVVRVVVFGMLALDSLLQISHAPRYGAGGFNVAHLPGLDALGPGRVAFGAGQLVCSYLLVLAACGVATRVVLPIATALYAWLYFGSQLDSYQHHYLVALVLLLACFVPWQRPPEARPSTPVRTWAVRLILIQLGILYLWAAISKMSPAWLDGRTLSKQLTGGLGELVVSTVGWKSAAGLTMLTELVLAFAIWIRPAWRIALPLGIGLHVLIMYSGLEIGLFAWLMLGFYLLVVPDRAYVWVAERVRIPRPHVGSSTVAWSAAIACLALGLVLARVVRLPHALILAALLAVVPLATVARRRVPAAIIAAGLAHVVAIALWLVVDRTTSQVVDYYRYWGGDSRRRGEAAMAESAYRTLTELEPEAPSGHLGLGRVLLERGDEAAGLAELHRAQQLAPTKATAFLVEAQHLARAGRKAEALEKARAAVAAEPANRRARGVFTALGGDAATLPAAAAPSAADDDDTEER